MPLQVPPIPPLESSATSENNNKNEQKIKLVEGFSSLASLAYKVAIAVGAVITFSYLFTIKFFPSGLASGEVIFFVFIALAFGFLYCLFWFYGIFSSIWIFQIIIWLRYKSRFRRRNPSSLPFFRLIQNVIDLPNSSWPNSLCWIPKTVRRIRKGASRISKKQGRNLPMPFRGLMAGLTSLMLFTSMAFLGMAKGAAPLTELLLGFFLAGFFTLFIVVIGKYIQERRDDDFKWVYSSVSFRRFLFFALPLAVVLFYSGPKTLLQMAFEGMGIRMPNVSIEVPESELGAIERAAEFIGRPILDCRRVEGGRLLLHNADVLWTGVGGISLVSFSLRGPDNVTIFGADHVLLRSTSLRFDSASLRVVSASPALDTCFDLLNNSFFKESSNELNAAGLKRLRNVVATIRTSGIPQSVLVRAKNDSSGVSDPKFFGKENNSQHWSEMRARAVAHALGKMLNSDPVKISTEGVGFHESKEQCPTDASVSPEDRKDCNLPFRKIELRVRYESAGVDEQR